MSDFKETRSWQKYLREILKYQISRKSFHWEPCCFNAETDRQTDRQTWRSLEPLFRNFANAPTKVEFNRTWRKEDKFWYKMQRTEWPFFYISLHRAFWYSHSSFTNRCTFIKTLITIYIKIRWFLHVSVYDHHQGACDWAWLKLYWY